MSGTPRILLWDLENTPGLGYFWGKTYQTDIIQVLEPARVMCFAAKWRGDPKSKVEFRSTFHDGRDVMLERAAALLDEADAVISYNGSGHDTPHITTEFIREHVEIPSPYTEIDLLKVTRGKTKLHSNRLNSVLHEFDLGSKVSHEGFALWLKCMAGDAAAWSRMRKYNIGDVVELEKVYDLYLPIIPQSMHPNMAIGQEVEACSNCGSTNIQWRGVSRTTQGTYPRFQCQKCGKWGKSTKSIERVTTRGIA